MDRILFPVGFELLAYTEPDADMPSGWLDTDGHDLKKANRVNVPLRYFSTGLHGVRPSVAYSDPAPALLQRSNPRARMPLRSTPLSSASASASTSIAATPLPLDRKLQWKLLSSTTAQPICLHSTAHTVFLRHFTCTVIWPHCCIVCEKTNVALFVCLFFNYTICILHFS